MTEHKLQIAVTNYLHFSLPSDATWFAVPNGGLRNLKTAQKLKAEGVRPGVADIIVVWKGRAIGLELKAPKGSQSKAQKEWAEMFQLAGGVYRVCKSVDEVETFLDMLGVPMRARLTGRCSGVRGNKAA